MTAPDEGTSIYLYFRIIHESQEDTESTRSEKSPSSVKSILIVDDEPSIREIYADILSVKGYEVHSVCDGSEVLPFLEKSGNTIDLILLDMIMPKMNGMETFKALRARYKNIPILLMSGLATSLSLSSLLEEPATAFFNKSLDYNQLIEMIESRF
jgi:DNA-binding NtrC family response regulator